MRLKVGKIVNTHSLKGEIKVISSTDFEEERFKKGSKLLITRGNQLIREVIVESYRKHKNSLLVKFEKIDSIEEAEKFKNLQLKVDFWVIKSKNGKEILIPYIEDVVKNVDIPNKIINIEVMEGLID